MTKIKINSKIILMVVVFTALGLAGYSLISTQKGSGLLPSSITGKTTISEVVVNNFEAHPVTKNDSGDSLIQQSEDYQITFVKEFNQFFVSILNPDFEATRAKAEQALLDQLGIGKEDACKLTVIVSTPRFINPDFSGQTFPLSFCQ